MTLRSTTTAQRLRLTGQQPEFRPNRERLADYFRWHHAQVDTGDIDPVYPVLRELANTWDLTTEQRLWLCVVHTIWYHPGSTLVAFQQVPALSRLPRTPEALDRAGLLTLPTGTERRGHRDKVQLLRHLLGLPGAFSGDLKRWARGTIEMHGDPRRSWESVNEHLATVPGNGRWAAYKTAELWQKVADAPITAADAGHRYSSGPRKGLADLYSGIPGDQSGYAIKHLNRLTQQLADVLGEKDLAQVETSLCDFHSLLNGHYYLGHDIDGMQEDWRHPRVAAGIPPEAWEARARSFAPEHLGEKNDWNGVRRDRQRAYRDTGVMLGVPK